MRDAVIIVMRDPEEAADAVGALQRARGVVAPDVGADFGEGGRRAVVGAQFGHQVPAVIQETGVSGQEPGFRAGIPVVHGFANPPALPVILKLDPPFRGRAAVPAPQLDQPVFPVPDKLPAVIPQQVPVVIVAVVNLRGGRIVVVFFLRRDEVVPRLALRGAKLGDHLDADILRSGAVVHGHDAVEVLPVAAGSHTVDGHVGRRVGDANDVHDVRGRALRELVRQVHRETVSILPLSRYCSHHSLWRALRSFLDGLFKKFSYANRVCCINYRFSRKWSK